MPCNYDKECGVNNCSYTANLGGCGLYGFLGTIDKQLQIYSTEKELIETLRNDYLKAWKKNPNSRGKGKATGNAFEKWIKTQIGNYSGGKVKFNDIFTFNVDIVIPKSNNPRVIIEVKILIDIQHTLALGGLLHFITNKKDMKMGLVTFYKPNEECIKILDYFKNSFKIFDYFFIQNGWSKTIENLKNFAKLEDNN